MEFQRRGISRGDRVGISRGDRVGIYLQNVPYYPICLLAARQWGPGISRSILPRGSADLPRAREHRGPGGGPQGGDESGHHQREDEEEQPGAAVAGRQGNQVNGLRRPAASPAGDAREYSLEVVGPDGAGGAGQVDGLLGS